MDEIPVTLNTTCATQSDVMAVAACLTANHANMLPLLEILKTAQALGTRPYRELEDAVYGLPVMDMSHNNEHVLAQLLVDCGALEAIPVAEQPPAADPAAEPAAEAEPTDAEQPELEDQPIDYLLAITAAGQAALAAFEPTKRLTQTVAVEPEGYTEVYAGIIKLCEDGASLSSIDAAFGKHPAMKTPKQVYVGHFISNLETAGGIVWQDESWHATQAGLVFAAANTVS